MRKEAIFMIGAIAAGVAVAVSLFLLYPEMMFKNTSLELQGGAATDVPVLVDQPATAGVGANNTSSTGNTTTGAPATTAPPY